MIYRCACTFAKSECLSTFIIEVDATGTDKARILARAKCLVAGLPLPRHIDVMPREWHKKKDCD